MKKLSLWVFTITILSISCTNDSATESGLKQFDSPEASNSKRVESSASVVEQNSPESQIDTILAQFYDQSNFDPESIFAVNEAIHSTTDATVILVAGDLNLTSSSIVEISEVIGNSKDGLEISVENLSMTLPAKASLSNFIENVMQFNNGDYDNILTWITLYKSAVSADDSYTSEDKRIIRTISSIAHSSLFHERKRKDKDWDTAVANKDDDFVPTDEITFLTVRMALLAGTIENNL